MTYSEKICVIRSALKNFLKKIIGPRRAHMARMLFMKITGKAAINEINLEFVNYCNLRCKWCSLDHEQKKYIMSEGLLREFFEGLFYDKRFGGVKRLNLFNGGETLLHPDFIGMMKIVKEYKKRFFEKGLLFPAVCLLSNGMVLNEKLSKELVDLEVLDTIRFSVDGGSREKYEELRKGAKWDTISKNIKDFSRINDGRINTGIICIIEYGQAKNTDWMSAEFKEVCGLVDCVELRYPHDWRGEVKVDGYKKTFKNYCNFLFHSLCLLPNGDVAVCCVDLNGAKGVVGNLYKESLYQIYNSRRRREIKYHLLAGRRGEIELCRNCG